MFLTTKLNKFFKTYYPEDNRRITRADLRCYEEVLDIMFWLHEAMEWHEDKHLTRLYNKLACAQAYRARRTI